MQKKMAIESKQVEYIKCFQDKTRQRFIENFLSTYNADERVEVPFRLFPRQIEFLHSLVENNNTIAIKHRQAGITTVTSAWITGQIVFANKKAPETVLCIGNKMDISQQLLEKIGTFLDQVPRWMWGNDYYSPDPESKKNKKSIYKTRNKDKLELFNGCKVHARSSGENAARGISAVSILVFDEAAFIQGGMTTYAQATMATSSVKDAKIVMVSTPNGKDQLYYRTYAKALKKENNYNPVEFRWFQDLRYNRNLRWYKKDENTGEILWDIDPVTSPKGDIIYDEERWRRLEKEGWSPTSPWYEETCKSLNNDEQKIAQEINVSFVGSTDNVIPVEVIEAHSTQNVITLSDDWELKDPYVEETWIWEDPKENHRYIVGCDVSSGASEDRTAIEILDIDAIDENGRPYVNQVLEYYGKRTGDEVGEIIFNYAMMYNNALVVVEGIGGYGDAAILTLMNKNYKNLYYDDPGLKTYTVERAYSKFGIKEGDKLPGFRTNSVRVQMIGNFISCLKENTFRVRSTRVIDEMETWIWKNGRADHMDGCHDDSLTCIAMSLFVMEFSMLKTERERKKASVMLSSWKANHGNAEKVETKNSVKDNEDMTPKYKSPFYSSTQIEREKQRRTNAMLLLGGFRPKK